MGKVAKKTKAVSKHRTASRREGAQKRARETSLEPARKLALLKARTFTEKGREQRIATARAALNAPPPFDLTLSQWKEIVETVEEED